MLDNGTARDVLRLAAKEGRVDVVHFLIEKGLNIDAADGDRWTALLNAACKGNLDVVQYLVEHGADKEKTMNEGASRQSALHRSSERPLRCGPVSRRARGGQRQGQKRWRKSSYHCSSE